MNILKTIKAVIFSARMAIVQKEILLLQCLLNTLERELGESIKEQGYKIIQDNYLSGSAVIQGTCFQVKDREKDTFFLSRSEEHLFSAVFAKDNDCLCQILISFLPKNEEFHVKVFRIGEMEDSLGLVAEPIVLETSIHHCTSMLLFDSFREEVSRVPNAFVRRIPT